MSNKTLRVTHNAAFFSCCTIRLLEIIKYFNINKELPEIVDSSEQFQLHKSQNGDITDCFFKTTSDQILYERDIRLSKSNDEEQFSKYSEINFLKVNPFVTKYFTLSAQVVEKVNFFKDKYNIDFENTCSVFYRGLDKITETDLGSHDVFIEKCRDIKKEDPKIKFFVQTDELDFQEIFLLEFPDSIFLEELPKLKKQNTLLTHHIPVEKRLDFGIEFLSATFIVSQCKFVVTHSGNCGIWSVLFRGNTENVFQWVTAGRNREFNPDLVRYDFWSK